MADHALETTEARTKQAEHRHERPTEGTYLSVLLALAVLTITELLVVYQPGIKVPLLLGLAATKAWLVIQFYMHLRYEARWLTGMFMIPIIAGAIVTVLIQPLVQ
jgi:caa(3)-type oxidase subunit IV